MKIKLAVIVTLPLIALACSSPAGPAGGENEATPTENDVVGSPGVSAAITARAACAEEGRYYALDEIVVDHNHAARTWQRYVSPQLYTHDEAVRYCESLKINQLSQWRLPLVTELNTLKLRPSGIKGGPGTCSPSIDQFAFPQTPAADFWSATTRPEQGDALYVGFDDGRDHPSTLDTPMHVRCVTDP